jgi:hypothetical protein
MPLSQGCDHQVRMEFAYAGGGPGKGGKMTFFVDGKKVGEGNVEAKLAAIFSADDGCDVGEDWGAAISPDYGSVGNAFNGEVKGVQLSSPTTQTTTRSIPRTPSRRPWGETNKWTFDLSLYGLAAGMSGNIGLGRVNADVDVGFDKIWNDLEMALFVDIGIDSEMPVIEPPCLQNPQHLQARTRA